MEQGKLDQAESIYQALLAESPDDPRLTRGLAEVQRRRERPAGDGDYVKISLHGRQLRCSWLVTEQGQDRARLVLAAPGHLALRLVSFPVSAKASPVSADIRLSQAAGELAVTPPAEGLVGAAVGLLSDGGEFASITHCRPLRLVRR
jgi:hypothetical protein